MLLERNTGNINKCMSVINVHFYLLQVVPYGVAREILEFNLQPLDQPYRSYRGFLHVFHLANLFIGVDL